MGFNTRALSVLMWKHAVVRLRKFIHTAVELVAPILFFMLLYCFKDDVNPPRSTRSSGGFEARTEVIPLLEYDVPLRTVLYYPDSKIAGSLMDEVGVKLNLQRLDGFPNFQDPSKIFRGYAAYTSVSQLSEFTTYMTDKDAVLVFEGMEGDSWPNKLNYTIRMKGDFRTNSYEPLDSNPGPHRMFGLGYMNFMSLQWAVDSSYIKTQSGSDINQTVSVQEFPYYRADMKMQMIILALITSYVCYLSLLLTFVFLVSRLLAEKSSGIQELVKMVGVSMNMLGATHFLNVLPVGLMFSVAGTIFLKVSANPLIPATNGFFIFLALLLYFNSIVAMAFAASYIIKTSEYAVTFSAILYFLSWVPGSFVKDEWPYAAKLIAGLLPHMPMRGFWQELGVYELYGTGVTSSNMFRSVSPASCSVFLCLVLLLLQATLFYALACYLSHVRPGQYGTAKPWNFLWQRKGTDENKNEVNEPGVALKCINKCTQVSPDPSERSRKRSEVEPERLHDSDSLELMEQDERYFEEPPTNLMVGIKVDRVSKMYSNNQVLKDVSLNVYRGEITVLLGHNGAGKTTLMSIITGMTSATDGNVYVNSLDTVAQQAEVRKQIGLCPQHNMFFTELTLQEHIMFFTMLKQGSFRDARRSSEKLALRLGLEDKLQSNCAELSGGMKRRAQLACALAGDADVLILDEPTSGLDVETRRELWDLLLSLRGERTVLLTTHFMEEADALGDRVAALHSGELRCFATTMYLKKAIGTGYRLTLTTIGLPKAHEISSKVEKYVPDATVKEQTINSISFNLPASSSAHFPKLFSSLEAKRSELGIDSIGVGVSTLEEVFLKLCRDVDTNFVEDEIDSAEPEPIPKRLSGFALYERQVRALMMRQVKFVIYKKWTFLIMQVLIPILVIFGCTSFANNSNNLDSESKALALNLGVYDAMHDKRVLYHLGHGDELTFRSLSNEYTYVKNEATDDVAMTALRISKDDALTYNNYVAGIELNDTDAIVLYTTTIRHAAPVALNMLSNLLARNYLSGSTGHIHTYNSPIEGYIRQNDDQLQEQPKAQIMLILWVITIIFVIQATCLNSVSLPCRERASGARHIHVMVGCPVELYWLSTLAFHGIVVQLCLLLPALVAAYTLDQDSTIDRLDFLLSFALIIQCGTMALFAFMYLLSFHFSARNTDIILVACIFLFGILCPLMKSGMDVFVADESDSRGFMYYSLVVSSYLAPPYTMMLGGFHSVNVAGINRWCELLQPQCPNAWLNELAWDAEATARCCAGDRARDYFHFDRFSPLGCIVTLLVQFVVLMILVVLTERGVFKGMSDWIMNRGYKPRPGADPDQMVRAEQTYVEQEITKPPIDIKKDSLLVADLHKNYRAICSKSCNAVRGVSLSVKKGECFGLLGVNGAGKSSTFKMLTAEECPTRGRIFGNGHHLARFNSKYLQTLGYCPQFFGLDVFLTGEENLELVLTLRGFDRAQVRKDVTTWIELVGLEKYRKRLVESYSGGCVRRLGAASALCSGSELTLLDEPSAGVDVAARRRVWAALRKALRQNRSLVITSHSMDEMESLCNRIAIMSSGRVRALGSPAALRADHAAGHAVVFKVRHGATDEVDGPKSKINKLKGKLREKFNCNLKDEHKTMLHYHINETLRYSELFSTLEALRQEFPSVIEDYSVTETTLEEVFLSFAKETIENTDAPV